MRRTLALFTTIALALSLAGAADAGQCRDAKGKYVKCPAAASDAGKPAAASASSAGKSASAATSAGAGPNCKKGKRCGNACISVHDTCHK
jgi:hypothetical protein